jgi:single-strand DNA-binding protein
MAGFEQTIIVGNVGNEPVLKQINSGSSVCTFTIAVSRRWRDKQTQEQRENTNWYRCSAWNGQADLANRLIRKGMNVMVVGVCTASAYAGQDGQPRASLELRVDQFQLLGNRSDNQTGAGNGEPQYNDNYEEASSRSVDDIPF